MGKNLHFHNDLIWRSIGWVMAVVIIYLSLASSVMVIDFTSSDKISHVLAYCVLMGWFCQIYISKKHQLLLAIAFTLMGVSLEVLQGLGGHRFFEYADMAANTAGVFLGWWLSQGWCAGWLFRADQALSRQ